MAEICQILALGQIFFSPTRSLQKIARFAYFWPANRPSGNYESGNWGFSLSHSFPPKPSFTCLWAKCTPTPQNTCKRNPCTLSALDWSSPCCHWHLRPNTGWTGVTGASSVKVVPWYSPHIAWVMLLSAVKKHWVHVDGWKCTSLCNVQGESDVMAPVARRRFSPVRDVSAGSPGFTCNQFLRAQKKSFLTVVQFEYNTLF